MVWTVTIGENRFEASEDWAKLPQGWSFNEVSGIGVDSADRVYVFSRSAHPLTVFDRDGTFLRSLGEGDFVSPHALQVTPNDELLLTDAGANAVHKYSLDGRKLMTIGTPGSPAPYMSGLPFNRPTHTAVSPQGDIYVSDGYGNARVHRYSPDGDYIESWGNGTGTDPGQFNVVHNICCDPEGMVYVADRENHRIQIFDGAGRYQGQINNLHRPCGLFMPYTKGAALYVGELGPIMRVNRGYKGLGPRVSIVDRNGTLLGRFGAAQAGEGEDEFIAPHCLATDSHGDIYVGEVSRALWSENFPDRPVPDGVRCLRKFKRLA